MLALQIRFVRYVIYLRSYLQRLGLLAVAIVSICGCNKDAAPAPSQSRFQKGIEALNILRANILRTPETDQTAVPRIDHILSMLNDNMAFEHHGYLIASAFSDDPTITGADSCFIFGVSRVGQIARVDFLDDAGNPAFSCDKPRSVWQWKDSTETIGIFVIGLYFTPSQFDPPDSPSSPEVKQGSAHGFEMVHVPAGTDASHFSAKVIFADGYDTDTVRCWKVAYKTATTGEAENH